MQPLYAYPRLSRADALAIREQLLFTAEKNPSAMSSHAHVSHPNARPVPTGAAIASPEMIGDVRQRVIDDLDRWVTGKPLERSQGAHFDRALGASLEEHLRILPSDAGHEGTWSFLTAVVFPDIAWMRYPTLHKDRILGNQHRNTLRRVWFRHTVVGDLISDVSNPLGEDEMVGLFERPTIAMNRTLARLLAKKVLDYSGPNRSDYARNLTKRALLLTGTYLLDGMEESDISSLLHETQDSPRPVVVRPPDAGPLPAPSPPDAHVPQPVEALTEEELIPAEPGAETPIASDSDAAALHDEAARTPRLQGADLVTRFHAEMTRLAEEVEEIDAAWGRAVAAGISWHGGRKAARVMGGSHKPMFTAMMKHRRVDLTIEALVLREEYRELFEENFLQECEARIDASSIWRK